MTRLRKCICVLLMAVLLITRHAFSVIASNDSEGSGRQVSLLVGLGIMEGNASGNLDLEKNVTRAEFAAMIFRMLDLEAIPYDPIFQDVNRSSWAFDYVQTVAGLGYLTGDGDGNFRPDNTIVTEEAVKTMVAVLGYTHLAEDKGGYPIGYISVGVQIGVLQDMDFEYGKELTRGEIAQILYNCLDIKLMQQNNIGSNDSGNSTILSDYLHVKEIRGNVRANHLVNLDGDYEIAEGQAVIDQTLYYVGDTDIDTQLGSTVHAYVKLNEGDSVQTVMYYELTSQQEKIIVEAEDILPDTTETRFIYMEGNRTKTVNIPQDVNLVWNGKTKFEFTGETLKPKEGNVTLITENGELILIYVNSYVSRVIQSVSADTKTVFYKNSDDPTELNDPQIKYTIMKKDKEVDIDELNENDIVSVAKSEDGMAVNMIVSNELLTGTVTAMSEDKCTINGMSYPISPYYTGSTLRLNKEGTFYFDAFGYIVFAEYDSQSLEYAFLISYQYDTSPQMRLKIKLLTMSGRIEEKIVGNTIRFNGSKIKAEALTETLGLKQLIKIRLSSADEVSSIWTAEDHTENPGAAYDTEEFTKDVEGVSLRYRDSLFSDGNGIFCTDNNTLVMVVTLDSSDNVNERECYVSTAPETFAANTRYSDIVFYDLDAQTRMPGIILRIKKAGASSVNIDNDVCVIEGFYDTIDRENNQVRGLRYYRAGQLYEAPVDYDIVSTCQNGSSDSSNVPEIFRNTEFNDLQKGDVIQISINTDGAISAYRPVFIRKYATGEYAQLVSGGSGYAEFPTFETFYGMIGSWNMQIININIGTMESSLVCTRPTVYLMDTTKDRLEVLNNSDLYSYLNNADVFVYASRKICQSIVIYV